MIDIFVEDIEGDDVKVYFVHLGFIYKCKKKNIKTLCNNIVSLYYDYNLEKYNKIEYNYLTITIYNKLYNSFSKVLFEEHSNNIKYIVRKIC